MDSPLPQETATPASKRGYNVLSVVSLAISACSVAVVFALPIWVFMVAGLIGLALSMVSLNQIGKRGEKGRTYAIFAFILGFCTGVLPLLGLILSLGSSQR
jgi:hypothetical protein